MSPIASERSSYESLLGTIDVPTLIIVGVEDTVTPVEISQKMAQAIPNAKLSLIEGAAHAPSIEHPEQFNQAVREWSRQGRRRRAKHPDRRQPKREVRRAPEPRP